MAELLTIDGSLGEGGGQILRTSLGLSLCLGKPFRIINIRSRRRKPGLMLQHLMSVQAAAKIGDAEVKGAELKSKELTFHPRRIVPGNYHFDIGSAGSTTLVLQTILPSLLLADAPSTLVLKGGTHNPLAPPFEFLERAFLPIINRMRPQVEVILERPGFYPAGGGSIRVHVCPADRLQSFQLLERGSVEEIRGSVLLANLPEHIADRELKVIGRELGLPSSSLYLNKVTSSKGPGNVVTVMVRSSEITEVFTGFGEKGVMAETVAEQVVQRVRRYLNAGVPVGEQLADQILLPMALAGEGEFLTLAPSLHTKTNLTVIQTFINLNIVCEEISRDVWKVSVN